MAAATSVPTGWPPRGHVLFPAEGHAPVASASGPDHNAGLINEAEAKRRRAELSDEADFFGSMDGASKFVRGDAVAGRVALPGGRRRAA